MQARICRNPQLPLASLSINPFLKYKVHLAFRLGRTAARRTEALGLSSGTAFRVAFEGMIVGDRDSARGLAIQETLRQEVVAFVILRPSAARLKVWFILCVALPHLFARGSHVVDKKVLVN
ncbi:hypothetical protein [Raoultibacter timonensis]|uniref:hypothetical protein n=1 Tax=Raoultibacter timonensis TaxID=1907662 RepID=UPI001FCC40D1|nr:hypothetical protein [Raoultibacter timonensis]